MQSRQLWITQKLWITLRRGAVFVTAPGDHPVMTRIIIGTEAIADGVVTRYELQRWFRPLFPNVHAPRDHCLTLRDRIEGAWLWSRRRGVITGLAAAALHGADWIAADSDVELIYKCPRPPRGIIARNERINADDWGLLDGLPVATATRTAFDLGRFQPPHDALARLDALMRVRPFAVADVMALAQRYRGHHGVARLKAVLPLVDPGAASPRESWWRKLVIDAGFPVPRTQIPVVDEAGAPVRILDFGWEDYKVAVEYDGAQHQSDRMQYLKDRRVAPVLRRLTWHVATVVKEDDPVTVLMTLSHVLRQRGWDGTVQIPSYAYSVRARVETASTQEKCG